MIQELLYTSHEGKGLRQGGGGGFCTVLSTEGMAPNLASALEQLSGYKHPFDIHDPRSVDNPINYRHAIVRIGGVTYHILSRIADLRHEHTGRSNKLAHHVALTRDALPPGGPSVAASHSGFCRSSWDGKVQLVPEIRSNSLPLHDLPNQPCRAWQQVTGDAGWAGVVADHLLNEKQNPIWIIFPTGTDTLALINEVFSLIPRNRRWEVTFSTYFTTLTPGTTCSLRFVLDGTTEAEKLRRDYRQRSIDLTVKLGDAPPSELVTAARTGQAHRSIESVPSTASSRRNKIPGVQGVDDNPLGSRRGAAHPRQSAIEDDGELELEPLSPLPSRAETYPAYHNSRYVVTSTPSAKRWGVPLLIAAAFTAILFMCILTTGAIFAIRHMALKKQSSPVQEKRDLPEDPAPVAPDPTSANQQDPQPDLKPSGQAPAEGGSPPVATGSNGAAVSSPPAGDPPPPSPPTSDSQPMPPTANPDGESAAASSGGRLPFDLAAVLPIPDVQPGLSEVLLSKLPEAENFGLSLVGLEELKTEKHFFWGTEPSNGGNPLIVTLNFKDNFDQITSKKVASFSIKEGTLNFDWLPDSESGLDQRKRNFIRALRWAVLSITANGKENIYRLSEPYSSEVLSLDVPTKLSPVVDTFIPRNREVNVSLNPPPVFIDSLQISNLAQRGQSGKYYLQVTFPNTVPKTLGGNQDVMEVILTASDDPTTLLTSLSVICKYRLPFRNVDEVDWTKVPSTEFKYDFKTADAEIKAATQALTDAKQKADSDLKDLEKGKNNLNEKQTLNAKIRKLEDSLSLYSNLQSLIQPPSAHIRINTRYKSTSNRPVVIELLAPNSQDAVQAQP